ncbi:MAG TPA: ribbon-helix-helix domain-containing protein [Candidatus Limnocylindrales bacterium]|jgi:hypothetical protein
MRKTSVYLTQDEVEGLRQLAVREGKPQAELIREGIRRMITDTATPARSFRSLAAGASGGRKPGRWTSDELHRKTRGEA